MNHDQEHIRRLVALDRQVNQLFSEFLARVSRSLAKLKYDDRRGVWSKNRLIEMQVDQALKEFVTRYRDLIQAHMMTSWELSEEKNDQLFMKLIKAAGVVVGADMLLKIFNRQPPKIVTDPITLSNILTFPRRKEAAEAFMKSRLSESISPRVWDLTGQNKKIILETVKSGILEGRSAPAISRDLRSLLNNPDKRFRRVRDPKTGKLKLSKPMASYHPGQGVYRSSYQNALRLARTEVNMAYRRADFERWQQNEFILGYEVRRSATEYDCDLCDGMAGKYPKNFLFVGWHPSCRCRATPLLPSQDRFVKYLETGKLEATPVWKIPGKVTEYVKANSEKILKMSPGQRPYWIRDNFSIKNGEIKLNIN